jgi:hypothetical protein
LVYSVKEDASIPGASSFVIDIYYLPFCPSGFVTVKVA